MSQELLNHKLKCRLCFQRISVLRNTSKITESVRQKFFDLTKFELKSSERYSNSVCKTCSKSLEESSNFQVKMIDNQRRLYAFEEEAETLKVKEEHLEQRLDELLDVQIKTEVFDFEVVQLNEPAYDMPDENLCQMQDTSGADENIETNDSPLADETVKIKKEKNYSLKQVNNALDLARTGQTSVRSAAKRFGIPHTTLIRKINKKDFVTHRKEIFLTDEEELKVRIFVKNRNESDMQSTNEDIVTYAIRILKKRKRNCSLAVSTLSTSWIESFRERHGCFSEFQSFEGFAHVCDLCNFSSQNKRDLRIHINFHVGKMSERQPPAKRKIYSKSDLETATRLAADGSMLKSAAAKLFGIPRSTLSKQLSRNVNNLKDVEDKPSEVHKCLYCDQIFFNYWSMRSHTKKHLEPEGEFKCEECGKVFLTMTRLKEHKLIHKPGVFRCKRCDLVFDMLLDAQKHYAGHRTTVPCEICGKLVSKGRHYTRHIRSHGEPQFKCPFEGCLKQYQLKAGLSYHIENVHTPKQTIQCQKCDSSFPNALKLKRHEERSHGEARFFCEVNGCSYKNTRKEYLKLHLRNHKDIDVKLRDELIANIQVRKAYK